MQLKDRTGIVCDFCGTECRIDFTYYSLDCKRSSAGVHERPSLLMARHNRSDGDGVDLCESCFATLSDRVKANYRAVQSGLVCDLSGVHMSGSFNYWYVDVTKATVRLSAGSGRCGKCSAPSDRSEGPCVKCGWNKYVRPARVSTSEHHLELAISELAYGELRDRAARTRASVSEWSTSSE